MNLFGRHRFAFDDRTRFRLADYAENDFAGLAGIARPMNFGAALLELFAEFCQILVQVIDCFPFDFGRSLSSLLPVLKARFGFVTDLLILAQSRFDDLAMAQIASHAPCLASK